MKQMTYKRCDECLMTPNKIVRDARRDEILAECERKNCLFNCHKATIAGRQDVACRGHGEHVFGKTNLEALITAGLVTLVDSNELLAEWERRRAARRR
jgi:hypothetical protein